MVAHGGVGCLCGWSQSECDEKIPEILTPIGLVPHPRIGMVWAAHPSGKQSKSLEKVISRAPLENRPGLPGDGGYFLHAHFLKFHHPITGEQINLEAALPSGFSLHQ